MDSLISRQAVINCYKKWQPYMSTKLLNFEKELYCIPSVTPSYNSIKTELKPSEDCISKQKVLDAIDAYKYLDGNDAIYRLKQWLNEQESVQPKMGRWIPVSERLPEDKCKTYLVCSDDGYIATIMYDGNGRWLIDDCKIIAWMPLPTAWKGED